MNRPLHPQFKTISEVIRRLDATIDQGNEYSFIKILAGLVLDGESIKYMALERERRAREAKALGLIQDTVGIGAGLWLEAFVAGVAWTMKESGLDHLDYLVPDPGPKP